MTGGGNDSCKLWTRHIAEHAVVIGGVCRRVFMHVSMCLRMHVWAFCLSSGHSTYSRRPSQAFWHRFTSNAIYSLWAQLFIICVCVCVFFILFNHGLDPMLRGLFSCETRPCRPRLTTHNFNRVSCSLTNELCPHSNRTGGWEMNTGMDTRRRNNAW